MSKIVKQGQSFIDKVTQLTGSLENALEVAIANNTSITNSVAIGSEVIPTDVTSKRVVSFFNSYNEPATATTQIEIDAIENIGIGVMIIEDTFIVA